MEEDCSDRLTLIITRQPVPRVLQATARSNLATSLYPLHLGTSVPACSGPCAREAVDGGWLVDTLPLVILTATVLTLVVPTAKQGQNNSLAVLK